MIRNRVATSIGIAWHFPSESGGEISGIGMEFYFVPSVIKRAYFPTKRVKHYFLLINKISFSRDIPSAKRMNLNL